MKILRNAGIALGILILACIVGAILVVRTARFREFVREKAIAAVEQRMGGRVEIGSFVFEWTHLRAVLTDFVIHGSETRTAPPFLRARHIEIGLRFFTDGKLLDIADLQIDRPEANILIAEDGTTNIPKPGAPSTSKNSPLETVVDLAVEHFRVSNGAVSFNSRKQDLDLQGNGLRVQLQYDSAAQDYHGELSFAPVYIVAGRRQPVNLRITLPVELQRDRVAFRNARIDTDASAITLDGSIENLRNPRTSAHIQGRVSLADVSNLANLPLHGNIQGAPSAVVLDVNATMGENRIDVANSRVALGASFIEASGLLRDPTGKGSLHFRSRLAIAELGRLAQTALRPQGAAELAGTATIGGQNNYDVEARLDAAGISFQADRRRIANVSFRSPVHLTPRALQLNGFQLDALGAQIAGTASLEDFARYQVTAALRRFDLRQGMREVARTSIPYDGSVSGSLAAAGDLKAPGVRSLLAHVQLAIAPGQQGIPVSGRLNADYQGAADRLAITSSYLALPHTRLTFDGSLDKQMQVSFTTSDLNDFRPLLKTQPPVTLSGMPATFAGTVTGRLAAPRIAGRLSVSRFAVEGRGFDLLTADLAASNSRAAVSNGDLQRGAMQAHFQASVGLRDWRPMPAQPLSAQAAVRNADLADLLAMAGVKPDGDSGALTADVNVAGTLGNPRGSVNVSVMNGTIQGEPFDAIRAQADLTDQLVTVSAAQFVAGSSRVDLTAEFRHPRDQFSQGQIHAHLGTTPIELAGLPLIQKWRPQTAGVLQLDADLRGDLRDSRSQGPASPEFQPVSIALNASGRGLQFDGQKYGDFQVRAQTSGQTVSYTAASNFAGARIQLRGGTQIAAGYPTNAEASIGGLPIDRVVQLARANLPVQGMLAANIHFAGSLERPEGSVDATVNRGIVFGQPIDRVRARVNYQTGSIDVPELEIRSGPSDIELAANYNHPPDGFRSGDLQLEVKKGQVDLARLQFVQRLRPGLEGMVRLAGGGRAAVRSGNRPVTPRELNFNLMGSGLAINGKSLGSVSFDARSTGGPVEFALDSTLAGAAIHGRGHAEVAGDYPVQAQMTFQNVAWQQLAPLFSAANAAPSGFDAVTDGSITINGPILRSNQLNGSFQLTRLQFSGTPPATPAGRAIFIQNEGPVALTLDRGVLRIVSLHLSGPNTDLQAGGNISLPRHTMDAMLRARTDLSAVQQLKPDLLSSGEITADATLRGTFEKPLVNGAVQLRKVSMHSRSFANGISNAEGTIQLSGAAASIKNVSADVGGGKVTLGGLVTYSGLLRFQLAASAKKVRVLPQPGVSLVADADLRLDGRSTASILSGAVTIDQVTYAPQSDLGSILSRAQPSVSSTGAPSPFLEDMKLEVQVRTSAGLAVQASVAQTLQADANLRLTGTAATPGMLGRVDITEGQLYFFSTNYTVNTGTISFYSPISIDPVLNLSLETQTKGVDVVLHVTGPVDNMKLTYTSDPPLPFTEIIGLLATGAVPTSDPTLLAQQPTQAPQNFQQMGESAVLSTAIADPIANRLQRVFGITQLKIDPSFAGSSPFPQATIALQQKVTSAVTLTYITAVDNPSTEVISGEWQFNPEWSVTATRDEWGIFSMMLNYKKRIH